MPDLIKHEESNSLYLGEKNVGDRILIEGNVAICWGAVSAGCEAY